MSSQPTNWFRRFYRLYSVVTLKIRSSHQNQFFSYHNDKIRKVWPEYIIWFKRQDADNLFWSKFDIQRASGTLKMRSVSPKPYHFIPMFQWCFCASLVKSTNGLRRCADKAHF